MEKYYLFISTLLLLAVPVSISLHLVGNSVFNAFMIFPLATLITSIIQVFYYKHKALTVMKYLIPGLLIGFYGLFSLLFWVMLPVAIVCIIVSVLQIPLCYYELKLDI